MTAIRIEVEQADLLPDVMGAMSEAIGSLLANEAMEYPVHVSALACNGSGLLMRYVLRPDGDGADVITLAEHDEGAAWKLPVHARLMDSVGYTARVILTVKKTGA